MAEEITTSSSGGRKGVKPERFSQFPVDALMEVARQFGIGAEKYDAHNFRKGYEYSKSFDALMRHAWLWWGGEELDPESGTSHMAAVAWHALNLMTLAVEHPEFDDRYKPEPEPSSMYKALVEHDLAATEAIIYDDESVIFDIVEAAMGSAEDEVPFRGILDDEPPVWQWSMEAKEKHLSFGTREEAERYLALPQEAKVELLDTVEALYEANPRDDVQYTFVTLDGDVINVWWEAV